MSSKTLFNTKKDLTMSTNNAGGVAYSMSDEHALAQYAFTGTFSNTYYATANAQLDKILELAKKCSPEYVAKCAVAARQSGYMKDTPAFLLAHLASLKTPESIRLLELVFPV